MCVSCVSEESKAYRLYNPTTKKILVSKDVVFAENETWNLGTSEATKSAECDLDEETPREHTGDLTSENAGQNERNNDTPHTEDINDRG